MHILVVDEEIPFPLNSGKRLRTFNLLKPLASRHDITFICRRHEHLVDNNSIALEQAGIKTLVVPDPIRKKQGWRFFTALFANLFSPYPYSVSSHYSHLLISQIKTLVKEKQFDLIHCEWTPYAINIQQWLGTIPAVVDAHNIEAMIWGRNFQVEKNLFKKAYIYLQWQKMSTFEKRSFAKFNRCVAVSIQDAKLISETVPEERIDVVANGVDTSYFKRNELLNQSKTPSKKLVFTGSLDWRPNVDGLLYFLDKVFPLIKKRSPQCHLIIVGRNPMAVLRAKVADMSDATLTGTVDDVRPYMEEAAVYVVPLRVGGGSRLKILEALSMEMPVVSTTIGAEGLDVTPNQDILLADTPEEFTEAVITVLNDSDKADELGKRGRHLVEAQYRWHALAIRLEKSWHKAMEAA